MARRDAARGGDRGGEGIQAPRPRHARLATGAAALAAASALAAYPPLQGTLSLLLYGIGAAALALLAGGLTGGWSSPVGIAFALLGAEYAVLFAAGPSRVDEWTPVYAAGFLLSAELAYWSLEERVPAWSVPSLLPRRLTILGLCCAGAAAMAAAIVAAAGASVGGGLALEAVGIAAVVGVLAVVAGLARVGGALR